MAKQYKRGLSLSFVVMTVLLIEVLVGTVSATTIYYSLRSLVLEIDESTRTNGRTLVRILENEISQRIKRNKPESISSSFYETIRSRPEIKRQIKEIVLLDRQGRVVAHSDVGKLAKSYISPEYNKPAFHKVMQLEDGSVEVSPYPRGTSMALPWLLPVFQDQIRHVLAPALKFSTPVNVKFKPEKKKKKKKLKKKGKGKIERKMSLHLIMNRYPLRKAVSDFTYSAGFLFFGALALGAVFSVVLLLVLNSSVRSMRSPKNMVYFQTKELHKRLTEESANPESIIEESKTVMQAKLLPQSQDKFYRDRLTEPVADGEVKDAIFIEKDA